MLGARLSAFFADGYTLPRPDSELIQEVFNVDGFEYVKTPTKFLKKQVHKHLYKKISRSDYEFQKSKYKTRINQSQAKGLLKYRQLEFLYE